MGAVNGRRLMCTKKLAHYLQVYLVYMYVYVQSQACMFTCRHDNVYVGMFTCTHTGLRVRVCAYIYAGRVHM